jgi:ADP-heptose:LPS heptosyltransferase
MNRVCLNMIVKNEAHVIERCLRSVRPFIDSWVIVDTGSTDGTQDVIRKFFENDLPGELHERPWVHFGHNRTEAIQLARTWGDYTFYIDADEVLQIPEGYVRPLLTEDAYSLNVRFGDTHYGRHCLVASRLPWRWVGVLHEYLECDQSISRALLAGPEVIVHTDGARSQQDFTVKYTKDAELLERALIDEPDNARYVFYLAQSYRDSSQLEAALATYDRRAAMGGWDEEVWYSHYSAALLASQLNRDPGEVTRRFLAAYQLRPKRAEPLCQLAVFHRAQSQCQVARLFAQEAMKLPQPDDLLFIDHACYAWRAADEFAIASYWTGDYEDCRRVCEELLASGKLPEWEVKRVQENRQYALDKLAPPPAAAQPPEPTPAPPPPRVPAIALHRPGAIGDVIITLRMVPHLKQAHPGRQIHYFCDRNIGNGLRELMLAAGVDEVHPLDRSPWDLGYEKVINLIGYPLAEGYPDKPMRLPLWRSFADEMGLPQDITPAKLTRQRDVGPSGYVTLQPNPGWSKYKRWWPQRWAQVIAALPGLHFIQIGAPGEELIPGADGRFLGAELPRSIDVIASARLHVGVDSFGHHAANFFGVRSVVLWGSTQYSAAGYEGDTHISLGLPCQPCFRESPSMSTMPRGACINPPRQDYDDNTPHACMDGISVERVVRAIRAALRETHEAHAAAASASPSKPVRRPSTKRTAATSTEG